MKRPAKRVGGWPRSAYQWPAAPSTTNGRIPPEAIAAVERVLAHRAGVVSEVPGQERWRQTTVPHQAAKAESHAVYARCEWDALDDETGEHHLAHAAARALLGLALYLQQKDKP